MNIIKPHWCRFCEKDSKSVESMQGRDEFVCVNGHYIISDEDTKCVQPKSIGTNISPHNVYRKNNSWGYLCNKEGVKL